jgi:large subunit ribosomal protein L24e
MVVKRQCSFCAQEIEPGTGAMFVKRDGTIFHFCSGSCRKQQLHLGRVGHRFKWTRAHALKKAADRSSAAARAQAPGSPVRKGGARPRPPAAVRPSEPAVEAAPAAVPETTGKKPAKARARAPKKADAGPSPSTE